MASKVYRYYVSYVVGFTNTFSANICDLEKKITTKDDIDKLRKRISEETGYAFITIVAFSPLEEESS